MKSLLASHLLPSSILCVETDVRSVRSRTSSIPINLGNPGRCPEQPILLIAIFDNSGSVSAAAGNDPVGNRFEEVRLAVESVAKRCRCGLECIALMTFDSPTSGDVPPTPMKGGMVAIEKGLSIPPDGGGSSVLGPSLDRARELMDKFLEHQAVLVVLSDFQLFDSDVPRTLKVLTEFPGLVHVVALRSEPPQVLIDDPRVQVTHVQHSDPPGALAKAIFAALISTRRRSGR